MKVVGLFRELGRGIDQSVQSIHAATDALDEDQVFAIVRYLQSAEPFFDVMETTIDPINESVSIPGGPSLICDGVWIWRKDLAYFVEKYKISLPVEFVRHVLANERVCDDAFSTTHGWEEAISDYDRAERGLI